MSTLAMKRFLLRNDHRGTSVVVWGVIRNQCPVVDLRGGARDARPPWGVQILSISCSFWENVAKLYVGAPPGQLAPPPRGNPGSATDVGRTIQLYQLEVTVVRH